MAIEDPALDYSWDSETARTWADEFDSLVEAVEAGYLDRFLFRLGKVAGARYAIVREKGVRVGEQTYAPEEPKRKPIGSIVRPGMPTASERRASAVNGAVNTIRRAASGEKPKVGEGLYYDRDEGKFYRVRANKAGTGVYASEVVVQKPAVRDASGNIVKAADVDYVYAHSKVYDLEPSMLISVEQAKTFGLHTGRCLRCGKELRKATSIEDMLGPVCYRKIKAGSL